MLCIDGVVTEAEYSCLQKSSGSEWCSPLCAGTCCSVVCLDLTHLSVNVFLVTAFPFSCEAAITALFDPTGLAHLLLLAAKICFARAITKILFGLRCVRISLQNCGRICSRMLAFAFIPTQYSMRTVGVPVLLWLVHFDSEYYLLRKESGRYSCRTRLEGRLCVMKW